MPDSEQSDPNRGREKLRRIDQTPEVPVLRASIIGAAWHVP
jgi:hypothetical protein